MTDMTDKTEPTAAEITAFESAYEAAINAGEVHARACRIAGLRAALNIRAAAPAPPAQEPIPMILHCPACGTQHIDAADEFRPVGECTCRGEDQCECCAANEQLYREWLSEGPWTNPPHRSHLCHGCGHIWRPADAPTTGVEKIATRGKNDSPPVHAAQPVAWGLPNTAITGVRHPLMMVRLDIPSDDQYGGAMWIPLYVLPPDAARRIEALEAERDRLREALDLALDYLAPGTKPYKAACAALGRES